MLGLHELANAPPQIIYRLAVTTHDGVELAKARLDGAVVGNELFAVAIFIDGVGHVRTAIQTFGICEPDNRIIRIFGGQSPEQLQNRVVHLRLAREFRKHACQGRRVRLRAD